MTVVQIKVKESKQLCGHHLHETLLQKLKMLCLKTTIDGTGMNCHAQVHKAHL